MIKKLLHNKTFTPKEEICCSCCKIKKDWKRRNDSSNIVAALQPDIEFPISSRAHKYCAEKIKPKSIFYPYDNDCYCKNANKKVKPKLLPHPKTCISDKREQKRAKLKAQTCCQFDSNFGSFHPLNLSPTNTRLDVEKYRIDQEIQTHLDEIESKPEYEDTLNNCEEIPKDEFKSAKEFAKFRNDHYFETHSTDDILRNVPPHECKHEFELDGRLLPKPLNADAFGRSRCCICEKPISKFEKDNLTSKFSFLSKFKSGLSICEYDYKNIQFDPIRSFAKAYRFGLVPHSVMIGGAYNQIHLKLNENNLDKLYNLTKKLRIPQYCNSMALRQQKMFH